MFAYLNNGNQGIPRFSRDSFHSQPDFTVIGSGEIGGKAQGLAFIKRFIEEKFEADKFPGFTVGIPRLTVVATEVFDSFMKHNDLYELAYSDLPNERIAHAFIKAEFPVEYVGDLMALISSVNTPLAIRSSSLLEDAIHRPFAGVYATKMIPNNQSESAARFNKLVEAIKFVYASTFFKEAKSYIRTTGEKIAHEKMAVIIQDVVGKRYGNKYYPTISGVGKSFNYYPVANSKPEDGVVNLALGLGKTIVDGGIAWTYSPKFPQKGPPYGSVSDLLKMTQLEFWSVNMSPAPFDPINEAECLLRCKLADAEYDGNLQFIASTYNPASDRIYPGIGASGPRVLNFAPILVNRQILLNQLIGGLLELSRDAVGSEVEIEFALVLDKKSGLPVNLGFLQVRPMVAFAEEVDIESADSSSSNIIVNSKSVMGNGMIDDVKDIVYVKPDVFEAKNTRLIALELEGMNRRLMEKEQPYLLIGFGRWGSSDYWLGIPVVWGQICGAKVIVEATLPEMNVDLSQGSHFFHNLTSFGVPYFSIPFTSRESSIDWEWLRAQTAAAETNFVKHIHLESPLKVKVDGRKGEGVIYYV